MARRPRFMPPGIPVHVIQRGNNRTPIFHEGSDCVRYRAMLDGARRRTGCSIHSYVLMTNHVHLLVTPLRPTAVSEMMQVLGRRYVRYFNDRYGRTGTLWEGRFRAASIDSERYFFTCARYIELNPVRAGMVSDPRAYRWSSFRSNAGAVADTLVDPHALYEALGRDSRERATSYVRLFHTPPADEAECLRVIRRATNLGTSLVGVHRPDSDPRL